MLGVSFDPPFAAALALPLFPLGNVTHFVKHHPDADILSLVSHLDFNGSYH
jgi:hypothetical protein